ncbi:MAG: ABC transporter permease subunit [Thiotrichaceae bacterium]|nr:ABC transporter permease subunit [Thiotrichaceae bacterium]
MNSSGDNQTAGLFTSKASANHRRRRMVKDTLTRYAVAFGGISVIIAIILIFFYLLFVVLPLFQSADVEKRASYSAPGTAQDETLYLAMEEQAEIGLRFTTSGKAIFFELANGEVILVESLPIPEGVSITSFAKGQMDQGIIALGLSNGQALVLRHIYRVTYPNDKRQITPQIKYPLGDAPIEIISDEVALTQIAFQSNEEQTTFAVATEDGRLMLSAFIAEESMFDDTPEFEQFTTELELSDSPILKLLMDQEHQNLYVVEQNNTLTYFDISDAESPEKFYQLNISDDGRNVSSVEFLTGTISLIMGYEDGHLAQWFPVRDATDQRVMMRIRGFDHQQASGNPITSIASEFDRKGFLVADSQGRVGIYHSTAERNLAVTELSANPIKHLAIAPRANWMLAEEENGQLQLWHIHNDHPEISWKSLWGKVWYESYPEPDYIWQSSSASNDHEPKLSLVPLSFGTLKAAFYAMLLAAPLAILGAIFTAYFMAPKMRNVVKPSIEIMEALPTVILGFLAGLWLAPLIETHLPGAFSLLLLMPIGILLCAWGWCQLPRSVRHVIPEGWEAMLLIPLVIFVGWGSMAMSPALELMLFDGNMRYWMSEEMGVGFDQRNSIIVGLAMGFAVIPTIFSIAEDAIYGVPRHLSQGSLALGATPWQTMIFVVLLTASPGIFSALMIGMGRAVGETMIVLMATGNTAVMDFSIFEGMRTLSANISVEMPEAEVDSTHYRVLFLAALVLFMFTFFFNTIAEIVRQRLRVKYSTL